MNHLKAKTFLHKAEEVIPEESEDENDTLVELKNFQKLNLAKRKPLVKNATPVTNSKSKKAPKMRSSRQSASSLRVNEAHVEEYDDDIKEDEEAEFLGRPRVERFLSICEVPPEVLM